MRLLQYVLYASLATAGKSNWLSSCQVNSDCEPQYYCLKSTKTCTKLEIHVDARGSPTSKVISALPKAQLSTTVGPPEKTTVLDTADLVGFSLCKTDLDCDSGLACTSGTCVAKSSSTPKKSIENWIFWVILGSFLATFLLGAFIYYKLQEYKEERKARKGKGIQTAPAELQKRGNLVV